MNKIKSDIEIAQTAIIKPIEKVAEKLKIPNEALELYGKYKAKIDPLKAKGEKKGKLILVTGITPTKAGEGKSTTTVGLVDGLNALGYLTCGTLREPSMGPVFGIKGGAAGGGYAQVVPMSDINLHFTGDMHAVTACNNLISAVIDNHIFQGNRLNIDTNRVLWKRCLDLNDRALRQVSVSQGKNKEPRTDGFNITAASEVMAILCLAKDLDDFKKRIGEALVAYDINGKAIQVKDLNITGALAVLMNEAIKPNLVQTLEHSPVLMHGGPFANIAHGCNSLIATNTALTLSDYVVSEAGFAADLGAEKFIDIKCRNNDLNPSAVVIVATIRALKLHGGCDYENLNTENLEALKEGLKNLNRHIKTIDSFGCPKIVAINRFSNDSITELDYLENWCNDQGVMVSVCEGWALGSKGMLDLARKTIDLCQGRTELIYPYQEEDDVKTKISNINQKIYGGLTVSYSKQAENDLLDIKKNKWDTLPICIAKTQFSLSDDAKILEYCEGFTIHVSKITVSLGAGFLVVHTGNIMTMPALGKEIAAEKIDIIDGEIKGIF